MSYELTAKVIRADIGRPALKVVLAVLAEEKRDHLRTVFMSYEEIGRRAGVSTDYARECIGELITRCFLSKSADSKVGRGHATVYRINEGVLEDHALGRIGEVCIEEKVAASPHLSDERCGPAPTFEKTLDAERWGPASAKVGARPRKGGGRPPPNQSNANKTNTKPDGLVAGRTNAVWTSYAEAFENRYGIAPTRNGKTNGLMARFIALVGIEQAPAVAAAYLRNSGKFYVDRKHPPELMLRDVDKLRVEANGAERATAPTDFLQGFHDG